MSNPRASRTVPFLLALVAAGLLGASLKLPLWHLRMEAPQYRGEEALKVVVYPAALRGDLNEITTLNQYIGVHIPKELNQLKWLPVALVSAAGLGIAVSLLRTPGRRWGLVVVPALLSLALLAAALQAQAQMYDIGHKRDHKTKLVGVKDFTPRLVGKTRIAQFDVASGLGSGAYLIGLAILLQVAGSRAGAGKRVADDGAQQETTSRSKIISGSESKTASLQTSTQRERAGAARFCPTLEETR